MDKIKVTIEATPEQLAAIFGGKVPKAVQQDGYSCNAERVVVEAAKAALQQEQARSKPVPKRPVIEDPGQYMREPGSASAGVGRPYKLTDEGLKKIWDLHKAGYTAPQIAKAFNGLITHHIVYRLLKKIKGSR